jgi:PII-like signaling protein
VGRGLLDTFARRARGDGTLNDEELPNGNERESTELSALSIETNDELFSIGGNGMPHKHRVKSQEIGQVRIYMTPREKRKGSSRFFGRPLYQEIIDAAKTDGILNAVAHHTHYGYCGNGKIQSDNHELPNAHLNLCVELIAHRDELEMFCRKHGDLIQGKVIVYKHMEHWDIGPHETLKTKEASQEELDVDVEDDVTDKKQ